MALIPADETGLGVISKLASWPSPQYACDIAGDIHNCLMRLVLGTATMATMATMVAAIRSHAGGSNRLLLAGLEQRLTLLVSTPLLIEHEAVMTRDEHLAVSGLSVGDIGAILDAVASIAEPARLSFLWLPGEAMLKLETG